MSDDEKKGFVNRHGHRTDLNRVDLSDVSVERDGPVHSEYELKDPIPKRPKRIFTWTKRHTLITAIVVAVVVVVPVLTGEIFAATYQAGANGVHDRLQKLVQDKVLPSQKQTTIKASTVGDIAASVEDLRSSTCSGGLSDNLAELYPRSNNALKNCLQKTEQLSKLSSGLRKLESEARYIESILAATKTVTAPSSEPYAVISAQQSNWQSARDAVNKIHPPNEWQKQHSDLKKWVTIVADGWSVLNTASNAQDKAGFEAAEKALNEGYENIRTTISGLQTALHETQATITASYKAL